MDYSSPLSQDETPLLTALHHMASRDQAAFHTPGHKRGKGSSERFQKMVGLDPLKMDLPELPELDNLFAPAGVIEQAQELAANTFGSDRTFFLANGSTCGVIAAILATCGPGDTLLLPRNVHRSAISGLILAGAKPVFLMPDYDTEWDLVYSITPSGVAKALQEYPEAKAVLLVYPTYEGVCGDIEAIAHLAHQHEIPLLVDEAHGPHFAFHPELPTAALAAGADLVVQSTHKILSALTQAAMLHLQGSRVNCDRLRQALQLVQSTSPNYLLLASLDAARQQMALHGRALMHRTLALAEEARQRIQTIPGLSVLEHPQATLFPGFQALDRTRLTVTVTNLGISGFEADEFLRSLDVVAELPALRHLTFVITLGNSQEDIDQLVKAFGTLVEAHPPDGKPKFCVSTGSMPYPISRIPHSLRDAFFAPSEILPTFQAVGRRSAEGICPYPPGIPILLPGEIVTQEAIDYLQQIQKLGGFLTGCSDATVRTLRVIR
ncbi:MAG: aminotransferase class I/II-fold pyridoxal phosphate-dependent enzyme [Leptolyngbyaceae cyanobacterium bins.59]|nr:aminotransferase class I/II-fold pyridoxal phosphate-dependent enzyme [Leptolyngbyaceae cyanobacterium bins.59]